MNEKLPENVDPPIQEAQHDASPEPPSSTQPDPSKLELFLPTESSSPGVDQSANPEPPAPAPVAPGLRSARLLSVSSRSAVVQIRGETDPREVALDADVDGEVVQEALENGDRVMVEADEDGELVVAGVLRCRRPETLRLNASVIEIDAESELLMRSGKGALRIRQDGDIEMVGSRISAASRGLFRLVGKMLRLN